VPYAGDDFTLQPPIGWTEVSAEVNYGSYIESRWVPSGQPADADVAVFIDHTPGVGDLTPTEGANPLRDKILRNPDYDELQWSLQSFPAGQGRVWQFIYANEEEIDTFFVECGTGYAILGKAPASEFYDYQTLFAAVTSSLEPNCE
jgi:hypothetical protein